MFGVTEQMLNEQITQMAEFRRKQTIDKTEAKKEQAVLITEFRIMILKSRAQPAPAAIPSFLTFPVPFYNSHLYIHRTTGGIPKAPYIPRRQKRIPTLVLANSG